MILSLLCPIAVVPAASVPTQPYCGVISGLVTDKNHAGIPGATVTLLYVDNGSKVNIAGNPTTSNSNPSYAAIGMYVLDNVPWGTYKLRVQYGSETFEDGVTVGAGTANKNLAFPNFVLPSPTSVPTATATPTPTPSPSPSTTPTPTATFNSTITPTPVSTPAHIATYTPTPMPTSASTSTPEPTTSGGGAGGLNVGLILVVLAILAVSCGAAYFLFLRKK